MKSANLLKGYNALYSATNNHVGGVADAHEGFEFGAELRGNNVWPNESYVPGFKEAATAY
jgi:hypothetical protein